MQHADPCRACSLVVVWLNSLDMLAASQLLGRLEHDFEPLDKLGCAFWAQHGLPLISRYKSVLACRRRVEGLSECKLVLHLHFHLRVCLGFLVTSIAVTYTCRCTATTMFPLFATSSSSLDPQGSFICRIRHEHEPWGSCPSRNRRWRGNHGRPALACCKSRHVQKMQVGVLMLI